MKRNRDVLRRSNDTLFYSALPSIYSPCYYLSIASFQTRLKLIPSEFIFPPELAKQSKACKGLGCYLVGKRMEINRGCVEGVTFCVSWRDNQTMQDPLSKTGTVKKACISENRKTTCNLARNDSSLGQADIGAEGLISFQDLSGDPSNNRVPKSSALLSAIDGKVHHSLTQENKGHILTWGVGVGLTLLCCLPPLEIKPALICSVPPYQPCRLLLGFFPLLSLTAIEPNC